MEGLLIRQCRRRQFVSPRDLIPLEDFTGWAYCHGIVASPNWINRKGQRYWLRSDLPFLKGRRSAPVANLDTNTAEEVAIRDVIWLPDKIPGKYGPYRHPEGPEPGHWITTCRGYGGPDGIEPGGRPGGNPNADLIPFPGCERRAVLREIKQIGTGRVNDMPVALTEEPPHATTEPMLRHGPLILCGCEGEYEKEPFRSVITWIKGENDGMTEWITVEEMNACYIDVIKPDLSRMFFFFFFSGPGLTNILNGFSVSLLTTFFFFLQYCHRRPCHNCRSRGK